MEYKEEKIGISILMIIAALVGSGADSLLTEDQFNDAFVCSSTAEPKFCTGNAAHPAPLSGTLASCYWTDDSGAGKRTSCKDGYWQSMEEYCKINGIDPMSLIMRQANEPTVHAQSRAKTETCTPGDNSCVPA